MDSTVVATTVYHSSE